MALEIINQLSGRAVPVMGDDIDTDRIIPARFMKCVTFDGLGEFAFYDVRISEDGSKKVHPMNDPKHSGATILISGANFGCGSSREHAPQALYRYGFRAIIAESFAEIFFGNSTTLGMPCLALSRADLLRLVEIIKQNPDAEVQINVGESTVQAGGESFVATMADSAREALISGQWDPIGELLETQDAVDQLARRLAYV